MRIGIDGRLWNETGVGRYIRNLVLNLQKFDPKNEYVLFVKKGFKLNDLGFKNARWRIVETTIHWHSFEEQLEFPKVLNKENLDLMHFPYFSLPLFYTRPFVVTIHDLIINHFPTGKASTLPYPLYHIKRIGYDFVMDHAIKHSQKIIVPLNAVKDDVIQTFTIPAEKIVVTYEGVEKKSHPKSHISKINDQKYFLYVGNAYPHKNLERLIAGFTEFRKEIKEEIRLVCVGKDDFFYKRIRELMAKQKTAGIVFRHNVNDEELFTLYKNAQAFVSASLMEGFGLPPLETMSVGCPVILSDIPSFREVCEDNAFYFDPLEINSIKRQLSFVYHLDSQQRKQRTTKGLARVKQFSWENMARETLHVYTNISSKSAA